MNLLIVFITGLSVGGLTCLAVQGGLLASVIASQEANKGKENRKQRVFLPTLTFLAAKLIAYTILGFLLGFFGQSISINNTVQTVMQVVTGVYMLLVAGNLLELHPIFRYAMITPPRFLTRIVRNQSKSKQIFAPALLGLLTVFIPCGTTIAMEVLAIGTANPISGALIMATFVLGTIPLFAGIGIITSLLGEAYQGKFMKVAAIALVYLGVTSIYGGLVALGLVNFHKISATTNKENLASSAQIIDIRVTNDGYSPSNIVVKKGTPVMIRVTSKNAYSCALAFRVPSLGVSKNMQPNDSYIFTFTPNETGSIPFFCSMGMYRGLIEVR